MYVIGNPKNANQRFDTYKLYIKDQNIGNFYFKMTYNLTSPLLALYITCVFSPLKPSLKPQKSIKKIRVHVFE